MDLTTLNIEVSESAFCEPFCKHGKSRRIRSLRKYLHKSGIYLIKENNTVVYVGMSKSCVIKACYRHFEEWNDWRTKRTTYKDSLSDKEYSVMVLLIDPFQVEAFERALIVALKPRDNKNKLELINEPELIIQDEEIPF